MLLRFPDEKGTVTRAGPRGQPAGDGGDPAKRPAGRGGGAGSQDIPPSPFPTRSRRAP